MLFTETANFREQLVDVIGVVSHAVGVGSRSIGPGRDGLDLFIGHGLGLFLFCGFLCLFPAAATDELSAAARTSFDIAARMVVIPVRDAAIMTPFACVTEKRDIRLDPDPVGKNHLVIFGAVPHRRIVHLQPTT